MNQKQIDGRKAENLAEAYLLQQGMEILYRNYRCRRGEIDLIGTEGDILVFVEVKARRTGRFGYPGEAVDVRKQKHICRTATYFCRKEKIETGRQIRFDVVEVLGNQIRHIKDAFDYC